MFKLNGILQILDLIQFDTVNFGMVSRVWMLKKVSTPTFTSHCYYPRSMSLDLHVNPDW